MSVTHFDCPTERDLPPTPLTRTGLIESSLALPRDGAGCSLLGPSLEKAYEFAKQLPDHEHVLVVLSDYLLFDPDVEGTLDDFASFPGAVHAVVLSADAPLQIQDDARVQAVPVAYTDPPGAVARAVFNALTSRRRGLRELSPRLRDGHQHR
jgi:hypothetical protein